jgi:hypothetical protein
VHGVHPVEKEDRAAVQDSEEVPPRERSLERRVRGRFSS